jgi:hypothetical protein
VRKKRIILLIRRIKVVILICNVFKIASRPKKISYSTRIDARFMGSNPAKDD